MLARGFCVIAAAWLAMLGTVSAASLTWTPISVRGVVVYLLGGKWVEVTRGEPFASATLRTLRNGQLTLDGPDITLAVGPNSALQIALKADGNAGTIEQFLGTISLAVQKATTSVTLRAGKLTLSGITGSVSVMVGDSGTSIVVASGTAALTSPGGRYVVLDTGIYSADASGAVVEQTADPAAAPPGGAVNGTPSSQGIGNGDNGHSPGGPGNGNAGGPGNGNAGGPGNGAGNGGPGNSGNAGNGNANGNAHATSAGNGSGGNAAGAAHGGKL